MYGNGVYFAKDSSYALSYCADGEGVRTRPLFPRRIFDGYRHGVAPTTKSYQMYVVKVLVGEFTKGARGMKVPPSRNDPKNPSLLFDSVVDDTLDPKIFVIFQDSQCYPQHLITFEYFN